MICEIHLEGQYNIATQTTHAQWPPSITNVLVAGCLSLRCASQIHSTHDQFAFAQAQKQHLFINLPSGPLRSSSPPRSENNVSELFDS